MTGLCVSTALHLLVQNLVGWVVSGNLARVQRMLDPGWSDVETLYLLGEGSVSRSNCSQRQTKTVLSCHDEALTQAYVKTSFRSNRL